MNNEKNLHKSERHNDFSLFIFLFLNNQMSRLPYEIQLNVFSRLEASDQSSCELVCKAWSYAASETLYRMVSLYGYSSAKKFYHCIASDTSLTKLSLTREIKIIKQRYSTTFKTNNDFLTLLTSCANLQTLIFENFDPKFYLKWMEDAKITMTSLKHIGIHQSFRNEASHDLYLSVMLNNCATVTQLYINQDTTVAPNILLNKINQFPVLKRLAINSQKDIKLDSILDSCKSLTRLKLNGFMKQVSADGSRIASYPRLETLKITSQVFTGDICRFIFQNMTRLKSLTLISPYSGSQDIHSLMTNLQRQPILSNISIQTLVLQHFKCMSSQFLHLLPRYFSSLQNIRFKDCKFNGIWDRSNNLCIDMSPWNLNKITIDIDNIVTYAYHISNVFLQIKLGNGKINYYVRRKGKLRVNCPFKQIYCTANQVRKKMAAITGAVITIQIKTLKAIEIHAKNSNNQTITIQ